MVEEKYIQGSLIGLSLGALAFAIYGTCVLRKYEITPPPTISQAAAPAAMASPVDAGRLEHRVNVGKEEAPSTSTYNAQPHALVLLQNNAATKTAISLDMKVNSEVGLMADRTMPNLQTLADVQMWVNRNIGYLENSDLIYPDKTAGTFMPISRILEKGAGNCEEGFILMASALLKLGYADSEGGIYGLTVMPDTGEKGHIIAVYKDKITGRLGTAGIRNEDFIPPVYESVQDLAEELAIQHRWTKVSVGLLTVTKNSGIEGNEPIRLPTRYLFDVDIKAKYGLVFDREDLPTGASIHREILKDGYKISLDDAILIPHEDMGGIKGKISRIYVRWVNEGDKEIQVGIHYSNKLITHGFVVVFFSPNGNASGIQIDSFDSTKVGGKITGYLLCNDNSFRDSCEDKTKPLSRNEAEQYITLAKSIMQALGQKYAHKMFEQQQELRKRNLLIGR